ncbi:MAG: hypothetical protein ACLR8P_09355 [Clostridium fessum]
MVQEQLEEVRQNIRNACERSGRKVEDVTLIAVSKTKPVPMLQEHMMPAPEISAKTRCRRCWRRNRSCRLISVGI